MNYYYTQNISFTSKDKNNYQKGTPVTRHNIKNQWAARVFVKTLLCGEASTLNPPSSAQETTVPSSHLQPPESPALSHTLAPDTHNNTPYLATYSSKVHRKNIAHCQQSGWLIIIIYYNNRSRPHVLYK